MKIVIDLQGAQSLGSRNRGIGRYSLSLIKAILENHSKEHDITILLSALFKESIEDIKKQLQEIVPNIDIKIWHGLSNISYLQNSYSTNKKYTEQIREDFIKTLSPDIVLNTSLIEGYIDDSTISISKNLPYLTATILYDLIPYIHHEHYLADKEVKEWYHQRIQNLKNSDLLLSISESSREEAIEHLKINPQNIVNISSACENFFQKVDISIEDEANIKNKFNIKQPFILYTGGIDFRKNIDNLIIAYSKLPQNIKLSYQLAIVCSIQEEQKQSLYSLAQKNGVDKSQLIFTNYVSDSELLYFYNLCDLFVFPSWHEGFGLPILEAMFCNKAVIGSNVTSIPEVIGDERALFDPFKIESIRDKIEELLTNKELKNQLIQHNKSYSKKFTWQKSAQLAIDAMQNLYNKRPSIKKDKSKKPSLAYLSPLPPQKSGISDYSHELLFELRNHYDIDLITQGEDIKLDFTCSIKNIEFFKQNYSSYDRVLYHIGNSQFHKHMFLLLKEYSGVVVLHDFYLSNIVAHIELTHYKLNFLNLSLYNSHGYKALAHRYKTEDLYDMLWDYPTNLDIIQQANGIIMHSHKPKELLKKYYNIENLKNLKVIPLLRKAPIKKDKKAIKALLNLPQDSFLVCSFGTLGETKLNHQSIKAFINSSLVNDKNTYLIFVGESTDKVYKDSLKELSAKFKNKIIFTGWIDYPTYQNYLRVTDVALQLRTLWRGETSAAALDCMNYKIPTIVNANGSMSELDKDSVLMIEDEFKIEELISSLELLKDATLRDKISTNAQKILRTKHNPKECATLYHEAIEEFYTNTQTLQESIKTLSKISNTPDEDTLLNTSVALSYNYPLAPSLKQIFVDISTLVQVDAKSGIQRVVKNILEHLLYNPPSGYKVEPVYALGGRYSYARKFTLSFIGADENILLDEPIQPQKNDIFLALDLAPLQINSTSDYLSFLKMLGVEVKFVLYDLLPITSPLFFNDEDIKHFKLWLEELLKADAVLSISKNVASQLEDYIYHNKDIKNISLKIDSFSLGADFKINTYLPKKEQEEFLTTIKNSTTFIMVGTLEPRKAHAQTLEAFEVLWSQNIDVNLLIVGRAGWLVEELLQKIKNHQQLNKKLFFVENADDDYLTQLYKNSSALIASSYAEGFGLPLIEAAQHSLPIIARDIAIFREVAASNAHYFKDSNDALHLAKSIEIWLELHSKNIHPKSQNINYLSSKESAKEFVDLLIN